MNRIATFVYLALLTLCLGCGKASPPIESPMLEFVGAKTERDGLQETMELYGLRESFDIATFRQLCQRKKSTIGGRGATYVVVFDKPESATFPTSPFSAMFGVDWDTMAKIKAMYVCNPSNGYSTMTIYDPNMLDGKSASEDI